MLAEGGPLVVDTGKHTGRSPTTSSSSASPARRSGSGGERSTSRSSRRASSACTRRWPRTSASSDLYVVDAYAGADPAHRLAVRVVTPSPFHALFARTMFIAPEEDELEGFAPERGAARARRSRPTRPRTARAPARSSRSHPAKRRGPDRRHGYTGEIKKSIFTADERPAAASGAFPMHCSANVGDAGDVAIFFGLSGTGKTTLSADPERHLIGDDEHGWGDSGVFNFEGGCYAKMIRLSRRGRAGDLRDDAQVRDAARERRHRRGRPRSTSTATRRPRTRAAPTASRRSRTRCRRSAPATRRTSSS